MALPNGPVTLKVEELDQLNRKLSDMRHDVNNHLSLMVAALELIRYKMKKNALLETWDQLKAGDGTAGLDRTLLQDFEKKLKNQVEQTDRMVVTLGEQPARVTEAIRRFSVEFERGIGITRP